MNPVHSLFPGRFFSKRMERGLVLIVSGRGWNYVGVAIVIVKLYRKTCRKTYRKITQKINNHILHASACIASYMYMHEMED